MGLRMRTRRKVKDKRVVVACGVDLDSLDWSDNAPDDDLFTRQLDRCEVSEERAQTMFRRVEASNRKWPI
jgi:hypothetical protein